MATIKYSRQREAIKNYLMSTKIHPSADMVYNKIREEFPQISLGTIYRNLSLLVEMGEAVKVPSYDGCEHYDGDTSPHYHFVCSRCGGIYDIAPDTVRGIDELKRSANEDFAGIIEGAMVHFYGICEKCSTKS